METTTRTIATNGVELSVTEAGEGPTVVLCHGFPELAYSWRHQIPALAGAGYHAVAADQRGYGASSCPPDIEDYDIDHLVGDQLGLLDALGVEKAIWVGHDWGALIVWSAAQRHPDRVAGVVGMSVPFVPRPPAPPIQIMRAMFADNFFYMVYFQDPGVADENLGRDPRRTLRGMLAGLSSEATPEDLAGLLSPNDGRGFVERLPDPEALPGWLSEADVDTYVAAFERTGFTGPVNWYRNLDRNWAITEDWADTRVTVPSLFIAGTADPVVVMTPPSVMDGWVTDLRGKVMIDGAGHWVQQEKPDEVNAALLDFVRSLGAW